MTTHHSPLTHILRPVLVAVMFACIMESVALFIQALIPQWNAVYAVGSIFLISLEAFFAVGLVKQMRLSGRDKWTFRFAEWTIILVGLKLLSYAARGWGALARDMAEWQADITTVLTIEYMIVVVFAVFTWLGSSDIATWLEDLTQPAEGRYFNPYHSLASLQGMFFIGGGLIVLMAGLTQVGLQAILRLDRPPIGGVILNVLLYFIVGLALLSQGRLELLYTTWKTNGIDIAPGIRTRWGGLALLTLLIVAVLALLLPTRYGLSLLDLLGALLGVVFNIALFIGYLFNFIFFLFLGLLTALISLILGQPTAGPTPPAPPPVLPPPAEVGPGSDWLTLLRSLLFWAATLGILGYALAQFIGARREWWLALAQRRGFGWLARWLGLFWSRAQTLSTQARQALRRRLTRLTQSLRPAERRWLRLGALSPRELLLYFYLSVARRAAEGGLPRARHQTAREYTKGLGDALPTADPDLDTLTHAFEDARYSAHTIQREDTQAPRQSWERLRKIIRRLKTKD